MVTAIVIPIICIYFYWVTRKEMKKNREKWIQLENVQEESIVTGVIKTISKEKQRYYYHYFTEVTVMTLDNGQRTIKLKKIRPLTKEMKPFSCEPGEYVRLYGKWERDYFLIGRIEKD